MRAAISDWWTYGTRARWTVRDYVRHFGYACAGAFVGLGWLIAAFHP